MRLYNIRFCYTQSNDFIIKIVKGILAIDIHTLYISKTNKIEFPYINDWNLGDIHDRFMKIG